MNIIKTIIFLTLCFLPNTSLSNCNFKHADYLEELDQPDLIESIDIEIPKSGKYVRNSLKILVNRTKNIPTTLKKKFNANIKVNYSFGSCSLIGTIRQNGDWKDHIVVDKNGQLVRSLKVSLRTGNIMNAVKFKLLIPETRGGSNEVMATSIMRELGYLAPETFFVQARVNGVSSVMLFQEDIKKELLERNLRREGPIFEGDESLLWNEKGRIYLDDIALTRMSNPNWLSSGKNASSIALDAYEKIQLSYIDAAHRGLDGTVYVNPNSAEDIIFPKFHILSFAMKAEHGLGAHNRQFYYNALARQFEPIYYDGNPDLLGAFPIDKQSKIYTYASHGFLAKHIWTKPLLTEINKFNIKNKFIRRVKIIEKRPDVRADEMLGNLSNRLATLESLYFSSNATERNEVDNTNSTKELLAGYVDRIEFHDIKQVHLIINAINGKKVEVDIGDGALRNITLKELSDIVSELQFQNERAVILRSTLSNDFKISKLPSEIGGFLIHSAGLNYNHDLTAKSIEFSQTNSDDWALFNGAKLHNWKILFLGIKPTESTFGSERINRYGVTGCLSFYKSSFERVSIKVADGSCEDSLNIINSSGVLSNIEIEGSFSDAADFDFSSLEVERLIVSNAGNDCLDLSGGNYFITKIEASTCGDKGISVGEKTKLSVESTTVVGAASAVVSKDYSIVRLGNLKSQNVENCLIAEQKKQEFGGAMIFYGNIRCDGAIYTDTNSRIREYTNEF